MDRDDYRYTNSQGGHGLVKKRENRAAIMKNSKQSLILETSLCAAMTLAFIAVISLVRFDRAGQMSRAGTRAAHFEWAHRESPESGVCARYRLLMSPRIHCVLRL